MSNVFGKDGLQILNGFMMGKSVKAILEHTENKLIKSRSGEIKAAAKVELRENDIFVLKLLVKTIEHLNGACSAGGS